MVKRILSRGFALPSIMIASIVMLMLLATAVSAVMATRSALNEQYYNILAREAAESGVKLAEACIKKNDMAVTWSNAKPLKPNTDCEGNAVGGQAAYVLTSGDLRTSFEIGVSTSSSGEHTILAEGIIERIRVSTGLSWWTSSQSLKAEVGNQFRLAEYITSGFATVCGIFDNQTWCWGGNNDGKLGIGYHHPTQLELVPKPVLRDPGLLGGETDKLVAVSNTAVCIVAHSNEIYCSGQNDYGQLGYGSNNSSIVPRPVKVAKPSGMTGEITKITGRDNGFCAISGGDVWCWGNGLWGGNGINSNEKKQITPAKVHNIGQTNSPSRPVIDIDSDSESFHVCAIVQVGGLGQPWCWGLDSTGSLGNGTPYADSNVPVPVDTSGVLAGKNLVKITASGRYPMTVLNNQDPSTFHPTESQVELCASGFTNETQKRKCQRTEQTCALDTAGKMYCWGANQYGQLGTGAGHSSYGGLNPHWRSPVPVAVTAGGMDGKVIDDIATAITVSCGLVKSENLIYCWGFNDRGVIGRGVGTPQSIFATPGAVAMQTPGLQGKTIDYITGGANRLCAITTDQRAYCWGVGGTFGQIGDGSQAHRYVPTEATMLRQLRPSLIY